jgi:multidrug efflux system membrane fusion protein
VLSTGKDVAGTVSRRAPAADASTRTVNFEIDLPNADRALPVGTTAEILVDVGEEMPATEIPLLAAKVRRDTATVFVVEGSVVKKVSVKVLGERGGSLFVSPELPGGANVVTQGRSLLANDDHVVARVEAPAGPPRSAVSPGKADAPPEAPKEATQ